MLALAKLVKPSAFVRPKDSRFPAQCHRLGPATFAKMDFYRQIRGKGGKHTFQDENFALNTKILLTKLGSAILTFKSATYWSIRNEGMKARL